MFILGKQKPGACVIKLILISKNTEVRLSTQIGQINAPKSNDKVEINAGDYIRRCYQQA